VLNRGPRFAALWVMLCVLTAGRVAAHPLGNFTINHLAIVTPDAGKLRIRYVLDVAEIPTFQIMHASEKWSNAQMRAWIAEEATRVSAGLVVEANGTRAGLELQSAFAMTRPGAGGLPTLYWTGTYAAAVPSRATVTIADRVYADRRVGWRDIILPGIADPTNALRSYPNALIGSPRHNDRASFSLVNSLISQVKVTGETSELWGAASVVRSSALSDLFARNDGTPMFALLTILAAFGLGALHGLEPGHGKALLAFTLVGARATFKQAFILAAALTFAHTIAVVLLGLLLFFVAGFAPESIFTWITLISGMVVAAIGARSVSRALGRSTLGSHPHDAAGRHSGENHHHHDHDEPEHAHGHAHLIPGTKPLHFSSAVAAAMSGGIAPCPAAIVVLLTALHVHRVGYGLFVIVVFSLGLAAILTGLGLAVVHGAAWLQRRTGFAAIARLAPIVTGSVISIIGATMLAQGLAAQGVTLPSFLIVGCVLAIIVLIAIVPVYRMQRVQTA
jgi:nickel/cobalt transporter (NicO) family protein